MSKNPATPKRTRAARALRLALLLPLLATLLSALTNTSAQQTPQDKQQQRPRRVGGSAPQEPGAATPKPSSTPTPAGDEIDDGDVLRVDTQLVSVPAVVTDKTGRPLANLRAADFVLYEDGRPQQISNFATTEAPFEIALLLDTSGSTRADIGLIRRAARAFIDGLRPGDRVALVAFNSSDTGPQGLPTVEVLAGLTDDRDV